MFNPNDENIITKFWEKVKFKTLQECWEWDAATRNGYGAIKINGFVLSAHRVSYFLTTGKDPEEKLVCHNCDNKLCVNPTHLFLGTHSDNSKDAYEKGIVTPPEGVTFKEGHAPTHRNLSESKAKTVKSKIKSGLSLRQISEDLNIKYQTVRDISAGRSYANV